MSGPASHPIRVLHIFGRMDRGGAETRTLELFRGLDRQTYVFEFCSLSGMPGELDREIETLGGKVHYLRLNAVFPFAFLRLLRRRRFTAVHSHVHYFSGFILLLAATAGVPRRIAHFRSTADGKPGNLWRRFRNSLLRHLLDVIATDLVGVSEDVLDMSLGSGWRRDPRCQVIYSGIAVEKFRVPADPVGVRSEFGLPPQSTLVIHVGRMALEKNHARLVQIFIRFVALVPDARLLLVGKRDTEIESHITRISRIGGVTDRIVFAGVREDVGRLLASSDLMIFPSLREGLPGAVVEAVAAGIPVVASDIPGTSELAGQLPGLFMISLSSPDEYWASSALAALDRRSRGPGPNDGFPTMFDTASARSGFERLYRQSGTTPTGHGESEFIAAK